MKPYQFDKIHMDKDLIIRDRLYQIIGKFYTCKFYLILQNKIHLCYNRNGRVCKILFATDYNKNLIDGTEK